jgi:hypothetical protein
MEDLPGRRSTGEFGSFLYFLVADPDVPRYRFVENSRLHGRHVRVYGVSVPRQASHWHIATDEGQKTFTTIAGFTGEVWFDSRSKRVLRIVVNTEYLPPPFQSVQLTLEYGEIYLDKDSESEQGQPYLLPRHADSFACWPNV